MTGFDLFLELANSAGLWLGLSALGIAEIILTIAQILTIAFSPTEIPEV